MNATNRTITTRPSDALRIFSLLALALVFPVTLHSQTTSSSLITPHIEWARQNGITKYRLQIASDEKFRDMLLDRLITGQNYRPNELAPGRYYWRVAPSQFATGRFLPPRVFYVSPPRTQPSVTKPPKVQLGWSAAIGSIDQLLLSQSSGGTDLIAVNSDNRVYALDSIRGVPRWISRSAVGPDKAGRKSPKPLVVKTPTRSLVVFANQKNLQAVEAVSGREVWRAVVPSEVASIAASDGETSAIFLLSRNRDLFVLEPQTGVIRKRFKLEREPVNSPVMLPGKGVLIPVKDRALELRNVEGEHVRFIDIGSELTTPPLIVNSARGVLVLMGTRKGVAAFDAQSFKALGQLVLDGDDYALGSLIAVDLVNDTKPEIVVTTSRGRLLAVDVAEGKVIWAKANPAGAASPALADVNGDGRLDLVLPGTNSFAIALSGADGSTIWESEAASTSARDTGLSLMLAVRSPEGRLLLVRSDASGNGLQAIEVTDAFARQSSGGIEK